MSDTDVRDEVEAELGAHLGRLWRYAVVLSSSRDVAEDLVQATCVRALERATQFERGTRLDRWLFSVLHSIWHNEVRARRMRFGQGFVDAETALVTDGIAAAETHVLAVQMMHRVEALPKAQRSGLPRLCRGHELSRGSRDTRRTNRYGDESPCCSAGKVGNRHRRREPAVGH